LIEEQEALVFETNAKYSYRFEELEEKLNKLQPPVIKTQISKNWDVRNRKRKGKLANTTSKIIDRLVKKTEEKEVFCDLNGAAAGEQ
jgi:inhibitor of KinA sporulation pathway (predicted exonuclease)